MHHNSASVVELKQWSDVELIDDYSLNVEVGGKEHIHPSQQAYDYSEHLAEIQSSFIDDSIRSKPCAFCHNLPAKTGLEDPRFADILKKSPLFKKQDDRYFAEYLNEAIGRGNGIHLMNSFTNGRFRPNKKLLDILDSVINKNEQWHLLEKQRIAFNTIWAQILKSKRGINKNKSTAILVRGGPGTGKTVIATQLLADANRNNFTAIHSTGGKSFTTNLRAQFKGADKLFAWNLNMRNAPTQGLDVLLVDEAHRIRYTSDTRWTPKAQQNKRSQIEELLAALPKLRFFSWMKTSMSGPMRSDAPSSSGTKQENSVFRLSNMISTHNSVAVDVPSIFNGLIISLVFHRLNLQIGLKTIHLK